MNILFIILAIIAIALLITGGLVKAVSFLLYVGLILLVIAVIAWIIRRVTGSRV